ncbi:PQ-loop-domain-containing protein [Teratosphaeria nubilosa]|uniref:PQ-loop-domain-containing protein n=1 Tax=Teratosphaeria nubilosa TaxID=161662 RepID=A0A6G1LAX5_9PEZI|nr:PQ-loop-domain-containing protein [Teratosphaeria nubilosa]
MIILAIYYTFADVVLLGQCFYYRGFTLRDPRPDKDTGVENGDAVVATERTPLVHPGHLEGGVSRHLTAADAETGCGRNSSRSSFRDRLASLDGTHMSPVVPLHSQSKSVTEIDAIQPSQPRSWTQAILFNSTAIILVVLAGIAGYYLSPSAPETSTDRTPAEDQAASLKLSLWGQIFGYICAVLYLGSRVPQLLLNYRRKSTEGLNALFFLFACIGNLTYVLSIFAFAPVCAHQRHGRWVGSHCRPGEAQAVYGRYILVNLSWLLGSLGTLFLDFAVFAQFFLYRNNTADQKPRTANGEGRGRDPAEQWVCE